MYCTIKGVVLNSEAYKEQDKLITMYSYEYGKLQAVVASAKKIAAKLSSATEPITESEFMIYNNGMSFKIIGATILENNSKIKNDFYKNIYALYALEICDKFIPYYMENRDKYILITRLWQVLSDCKFNKKVFIAFILRFLKISGYSFLDYIKNTNISIDVKILRSIKQLSTCPGDSVDLLEVDEDKVWKCVESYLISHIRRPSLSIFLQKIELANFL